MAEEATILLGTLTMCTHSMRHILPGGGHRSVYHGAGPIIGQTIIPVIGRVIILATGPATILVIGRRLHPVIGRARDR